MRRNLTNDDLEKVVTQMLAGLPGSVDPRTEPPAAVVDGAKWIFEWRNMEAELAELTFDSHQEVALAGVRSVSPLRELTFVSGDHTIDVEIEPGIRDVAVSGTIEPPVSGSVQLVIGGEVFSGTIDETGCFAVEGVAHGTVLAFVETTEGKIRLGSFEV